VSDGPVELTIAGSEMEAAEICGYLAQYGIEATYERGSLNTGGFLPITNPSAGAAGVGPNAVWVRPNDLRRAQELLAQAR
jgi:hypothetical protein